VSGTECAWTADGATALAVDFIRGHDMKALYDQTTASTGTTPVSGVGKAAKFADVLGLVILVDTSTAIRIAGPTQAVDTTLAKLAIARATGAKKPAPSLSSTAASAGSGSSKVAVDLVITGDRPATIHGTKGRCVISTSDPLSSSYDFTTADYPSLGATGGFGAEGGQLLSGNRGYPSIKASIGGGDFSFQGPTGITLSANGKTATFDADLDGGDATGAHLSGHVTGTVTCS
jgi:hypothetical protein